MGIGFEKIIVIIHHFVNTGILTPFNQLLTIVGSGLVGINQATSEVTSYFAPITKLMYAVGAIVGLIGAVRVYGKFSSGDPDTTKVAATWFGACIFLVVSATILSAFFF